MLGVIQTFNQKSLWPREFVFDRTEQADESDCWGNEVTTRLIAFNQK